MNENDVFVLGFASGLTFAALVIHVIRIAEYLA